MTDLRKNLRNLFRETASTQDGQKPEGNGPMDPGTQKRLLSSSALRTGVDTLMAAGRLCRPYWIDNPDKKLQLTAWSLLIGSVSLTLWQVFVMKEFSEWNNMFGQIWQQGGVVLSDIQRLIAAETTSLVNTPEFIRGLGTTITKPEHFEFLQQVIADKGGTAQALSTELQRLAPVAAEHVANPGFLGDINGMLEQRDSILEQLKNAASLPAEQVQALNDQLATFPARIYGELTTLAGEGSAINLLSYPENMPAFMSAEMAADAQATMQEKLNTRSGLISQQFDLLSKDFSVIVAKFLVAAVGSFLMAQHLAIQWREWMTNQYTDKWLKLKAFYRTQNVYNSNDNPDQRIAEDVPALAGSTTGLLTDAARNVLTFGTFSTVLWNLSTPFHFASIGLPQLGQAPEGFMFYAAAGSALIGTSAIYLLGKKLPWLSYKQQKLEADFRTNMIRVRENAESIALNNSEKVEKDILDKSFKPVLENTKDMINLRKKMVIANSVYGNYSFPIPYLVAAPGFWVGAATYGTLMQAIYAFNQIEGVFTWFMNNFSALAGLKTTVDRLEEFNRAVDRSNRDLALKNSGEVEAVKVTMGPMHKRPSAPTVQ